MAEDRLTKEYLALKEDYPVAILLYQVGTFYRILQDDAKTVAETLGLKLMISGEASAPVFMCGFPKSGLDKYVGKLIRAGFSAVIVNQIQDDSGAIRREVAEVVSVG